MKISGIFAGDKSQNGENKSRRAQDLYDDEESGPDLGMPQRAAEPHDARLEIHR